MSNLDFCLPLKELTEKGRRNEAIAGRSGKMIELSGLSTAHNLVTLHRLICARKPTDTLEVGMYLGGSALAITASLKQIGAQPSQQHVAIDPYQAHRWDDAGVLQVEAAELAGYLDMRHSYSCLVMPELFSEKRRFDLIYIDGSHLFEDVFVDWYFSYLLLRKSGLVLFDDATQADVAKVTRFVSRNYADRLRPFDLRPYQDEAQTKRVAHRIGHVIGRLQLLAFEKISEGRRDWNSKLVNF